MKVSLPNWICSIENDIQAIAPGTGSTTGNNNNNKISWLIYNFMCVIHSYIKPKNLKFEGDTKIIRQIFFSWFDANGEWWMVNVQISRTHFICSETRFYCRIIAIRSVTHCLGKCNTKTHQFTSKIKRLVRERKRQRAKSEKVICDELCVCVCVVAFIVWVGIQITYFLPAFSVYIGLQVIQ